MSDVEIGCGLDVPDNRIDLSPIGAASDFIAWLDAIDPAIGLRVRLVASNATVVIGTRPALATADERLYRGDTLADCLEMLAADREEIEAWVKEREAATAPDAPV